jgi:hypothetical protein
MEMFGVVFGRTTIKDEEPVRRGGVDDDCGELYDCSFSHFN